ncbi:MAG: hypothetical protein WAW17_07830 [Rhodococcus sp. (in: high G+C Gram-positive bacteria)]|uniref:hypothetical protein n=1 Tax=Rhodococcus sp. TaxID=1831 RepID=UPI003BAE9F49
MAQVLTVEGQDGLCVAVAVGCGHVGEELGQRVVENAVFHEVSFAKLLPVFHVHRADDNSVGGRVSFSREGQP